MPKLLVGPIKQGLRTGILPFNIDNDAFPTLVNAYQWRDRVKRKRGNEFLGRLQRFLGTTDGAGNLTVTITPQPIAVGIASFTVGTDVFYDPGGASPVTLITNSSGSATLDRSTGVLTILGSKATTSVIYFPSLPVMGLEDLNLTATQFPSNIAFDTTYAYNLVNAIPPTIYDISFYKNPPTGTYPTYVQKSNPQTRLNWNGGDYQQFWTTNYQGAFWATNGVPVPFITTNIGMQFAPTATITYVSNTATTIVLTITNCPLVIGDFVFFNEWGAGTPANAKTLNFQSGYVTNTSGSFASLTVTIKLPNANVAADVYTPGIVQYLTNISDSTKDCIRWYDGDPTNGSIPPTFTPGHGWVNFCPPLSQFAYSFADLPLAQYYLVGAKMIVPFKDRLAFFGPVVQTSGAGSQVYLQDTVIFSQNGTPYYTASFTGDPDLVTTNFHQLLVPDNQSAHPGAFWADASGFGEIITAGVAQPIITVGSNQDALIVGFSSFQSKIIYTGNDLAPFAFYSVNTELGSNSTFSVITMDKGVLTRGHRGFVVTSQTGASRFDLEIPDSSFQFNLGNNGSERVTAQRDFVNEWVYFTYPSNLFIEYADDSIYRFNMQTLFYNYRDTSWGIFNETFTTYGYFRPSTGWTWATIGLRYPSWNEWTDPWNSGQITSMQQQIIAGNQQGYIMLKDSVGVAEEQSLNIQNLAAGVVSSPNHCLSNGDYIVVNNCLGTVAPNVNGQIFKVFNASQNTFQIGTQAGTYLGGGTITRMYRPQIQTKQFPLVWEMGRKTRIGMQNYLLTTTDVGQVTLQIFLSQDNQDAFNDPDIPNDGLVYSQILYTCPESTNLGLTAANSNLQMIAYPGSGNSPQQQIWHRNNTSLIGDTVQLGFTLSDSQMRTLYEDPEEDAPTQFAITGATNASPCVLSCTGQYAVGTLLEITGVQGMTELNFNPIQFNYYYVTASDLTTVTINVNSTGFDKYISGGNASAVVAASSSAFKEIELHGFVIDVTPSQVLA